MDYLTQTNFTMRLKYPGSLALVNETYFPKRSFYEIQDIDDMLDFTDQIFFPFLYGGVESFRFNYLLGTDIAQLNFRFYNMTTNDDNTTTTVFPYIVPTSSLPNYEPTNPKKYYEWTANF